MTLDSEAAKDPEPEKIYHKYANAEEINLVWYDEIPPEPWTPGMAFPMGECLSDQYNIVDSKKRPPITVFLPSRMKSDKHGVTAFCLDAFPAREPNGHYSVIVNGNLVAGQQPDITVYQSLVCRGLYHGFLRGGVLDPDIGDCRDINETEENGYRNVPRVYNRDY